MIALGGPKLKHRPALFVADVLGEVSMIALGGPKLKHVNARHRSPVVFGFNDSTGWA